MPERALKRTLTVWIWYPAVPTPGTAPAPYLPAAWVQARQPVVSVGTFLMQNLSRVQPHAWADASLAADPAPAPVLVMQPGLGPLITDYTTLAEALASQGYVVVGSNPTYSASVGVFQDGRRVFGTPAGNVPDNASPAEAKSILNRLITVWAADDRFILDQLERLNAADPASRFTGRLDLQAVGLLSHSLVRLKRKGSPQSPCTTDGGLKSVVSPPVGV
jgi:predicted dienelactone hydrolase